MFLVEHQSSVKLCMFRSMFHRRKHTVPGQESFKRRPASTLPLSSRGCRGTKLKLQEKPMIVTPNMIPFCVLGLNVMMVGIKTKRLISEHYQNNIILIISISSSSRFFFIVIQPYRIAQGSIHLPPVASSDTTPGFQKLTRSATSEFHEATILAVNAFTVLQIKSQLRTCNTLDSHFLQMQQTPVWHWDKDLIESESKVKKSSVTSVHIDLLQMAQVFQKFMKRVAGF